MNNKMVSVKAPSGVLKEFKSIFFRLGGLVITESHKVSSTIGKKLVEFDST